MPDTVTVPTLTDGYGNSFAAAQEGTTVFDSVFRGEIDLDTLGKHPMSDGVEFNSFEETIKDFIMARLGHPVVRVELSSYQIKTALDEAVSKFSYHAPLWTMQMAAFDTQVGVNVYKLPTTMLYNLEYVGYKKTLLTIAQQAGTLEFDFFIKYFQDNFLFQNFGVGDFFLLQQHLEQIRKVLGQEGTFNVLNGQFLQIHPTPVTNGQKVIVVYRAVDSNTIHPAYRNWIQRYALAISKGILGEIRGKYQTLPSPGGGAQLNGDALKQESMEEKALLEEELRNELEEPPAITAF